MTKRIAVLMPLICNGVVLMMSLDQATRVFHFEVRKKQ